MKGRIKLEVADGVAHVRQVCPERRNAIDPAWVADLGAAIAGCDVPEVRAVLITGDGPSFTVGGDLDHFASQQHRLAAALHEMIEPFHRALTHLGELPVPVVCAAQGAVAGGGLGLLWGSDVVVLADDAKLASAFGKLALSGDGGSSWALPRLVGLRRALQFTMGGRVLDAHEAVEWGIADEVVPAARLAVSAREHAGRLAAGPTLALGQMRRLLRASSSATWHEQLQDELRTIVACGGTADVRERFAAFASKRRPESG